MFCFYKRANKIITLTTETTFFCSKFILSLYIFLCLKPFQLACKKGKDMMRNVDVNATSFVVYISNTTGKIDRYCHSSKLHIVVFVLVFIKE